MREEDRRILADLREPFPVAASEGGDEESLDVALIRELVPLAIIERQQGHLARRDLRFPW